jgi:acetoin utilization deacetylase AcuC-like enzyme
MLTIAYHPIYQHPLPEGHRFPMLKYELIPRQLLHYGIITEQQIFAPKPCDEQHILAVHDQNYWQQLKNLTLSASHIRRIGFPLSEELIQREIIIADGTIQCALHAITNQVALNVAGGTHHAFTDRGEGFCLLNDIAIATVYLLQQQIKKRIMIVDLDVHQGNGTAAIFNQHPDVFTFSMHGKHNYPFFKETSNCDIALEDGTTGDTYLALLEKHLLSSIESFKPDFIFYLSGVDILETDKYGKLKVSSADCKKRDEFVFTICKQMKTPVAVAMGGGYSPKISDIVDAHCNTFEAASSIFF